jgi:hypothetical protein
MRVAGPWRSSAGAGKKRLWSMRQEKLSRRFTTCWAELAEAQAYESATSR